MKTFKEYKKLGFPDGYLKAGDVIDIDLAVHITVGSDEEYDKYIEHDQGIIQGKHPVDVIASKGVYETVYRSSPYDAFTYAGQCPAGETRNRNISLGQKAYICSRYKADTDEELRHNIAIAKDYCKMIIDRGDLPIAPHLYFPQFLSDRIREERAIGLSIGMEILRHVDYVLAIIENGKISSGMDTEMREAARLGIPVEIIHIGQKPEKKEER